MKKILIVALCLASLLVAQDKECKTNADKQNGCVENIESDYDGSMNQWWYKGGKAIRYKKTDRQGNVRTQWYVENIDKKVGIYVSESFSNGKKISESRCVYDTKKPYMMDKPTCDRSKVQVRKDWNLNNFKLTSNCEYQTITYPLIRDINLNGLCGECYKDGKPYQCDDAEKERLAKLDFSDFHKKCYRIFGNGEVDGPCKENSKQGGNK